MNITLPTILVIAATALFLALERLFPGRPLPTSKGLYMRVLIVYSAQLLITLATARLWIQLFGEVSLLHLKELEMPILEGFVGWFIGTFFFYCGMCFVTRRAGGSPSTRSITPHPVSKR